MLRAKENETPSRIAKELEHGCTAEEIIELNQSNPMCTHLERASKFKAGCQVWLPERCSRAYLCAAKVARAEAQGRAKVSEVEAEAEAARAEAAVAKAEAIKAHTDAAAAREEADALKAAVAEARAASEARTAAAGPRQQQRRPPDAVGVAAEDEAEREAPPGASAVEERLTQLDEEVAATEAEERELMETIETMRAKPLLAAALPPLEATLSEKRGQLTRRRTEKRTLQEALSEDTVAAEAEHAAKQRRQISQGKLAAAWRASIA